MFNQWYNNYPFKAHFKINTWLQILLPWRQQPIITVTLIVIIGISWRKPITGLLPTMHFGGFRAKGAALCHEGGLPQPPNSPHLYFSTPHDHCVRLCADTTHWDLKRTPPERNGDNEQPL